MGDGSVVVMSRPCGYWRGFVAKVMAQKAAAVFINGFLFHGAISPIEHTCRRGLFTRS